MTLTLPESKGRKVPEVGLLRYNGVTFPPQCNLSVQITPKRDSAGRTIKYSTYALTVKTIFVGSDLERYRSIPGGTSPEVDYTLEYIRSRLLQAGGELIVAGKGLGMDLAINAVGATYSPAPGSTFRSFRLDPTFGPFPTVLNWQPLASNQACEVTWSVEFTIPVCNSLLTRTGGSPYSPFLEFNYSVSWNISEEGVTSRTIEGYYEVLGYRSSAVSSPGMTGRADVPHMTADEVWPKVYEKFPLLTGFRRAFSRHLSADKRSMDFTITDTEIPSNNPYFPYMVRMDLSHRVSLQMPTAAGLMANNTISGTISVAPGVPRRLAWFAFTNVVASRFMASLNKTYGNRANRQIKIVPVVTSISIEEQIFGRELSFEFSWRFATTLDNLLSHSGLFSPVYGGAGAFNPNRPVMPRTKLTWTEWTKSMAQLTYTSRSKADLKLVDVREDEIFNICDRPSSIAKRSLARESQFDESLSPFSQTRCPPKDVTWISYELEAYLTVNNQVSKFIRTLDVQAPPMAPPAKRDIHDDTFGVGDYNVPPAPNSYQGVSPNNTGADFVPRAPSQISLRLIGTAYRLCYKIPTPIVRKVGGVRPFIISTSNHQTEAMKTINGLPIYRSVWTIDMDFDRVPQGDILATLDSDGLPEQRL